MLGILVLARAATLVDWTIPTQAAEVAAAIRPASVPNPCQFSSRVDMVAVTATVFDGRRLVRGLPRDAFRLFEDDISRPITYFSAEDAPLELFVAVDVSSSVRKAIGQVKANAARFLVALPPASEVTLVSFSDELQVLGHPATPLPEKLQSIMPLAPFGMTSLYDVLIHGFDALGQQIARHAVVMLTDGEDTASRFSSAAVEEREETSDAIVYIIGHGQALHSEPLKELCDRLATRSGGRAFFPRRTEEVTRAFDTIVTELSAQYLLAYEPRQRVPDGKWHRIRVEVRDGYAVRARQGFRFTDGTMAPAPNSR